jgi:hypothetical protein
MGTPYLNFIYLFIICVVKPPTVASTNLPTMIPLAANEACLEVARECVRAQKAPSESQCPPSASPELLESLWRHEYQRHIRSTAHLHRRRDALDAYLSLYRDRRMSIVDISRREDVNFSPYLLLRIFLEHLLGTDRSSVGMLVKDPSAIPDDRLRAEAEACMAADVHCGPKFDRLRADVGSAHEALLELGLKVQIGGGCGPTAGATRMFRSKSSRAYASTPLPRHRPAASLS